MYRPLLCALLTACASTPVDRDPVRIATFNASLHRGEAGELVRELEAGSDAARAIANIVQRVRPDVLVLNEVDFDPAGRAVELLRSRYLAVPQEDGAAGVDYGFSFVAPVNTGVASGLDLDQDGRRDGPGDAWGFGRHPGQYGMVVLSRFEIDEEAARTFRELRWASMPGHSMPADFWDDTTRAALRLSSKSHWDVPVRIPEGPTLHVLVSHPTPPVFDGPEDRNGRRNRDEVRFWADYLTPEQAGWIVDDQGRRGGLAAGQPFVICGDLNCDPLDGDSRDAPVRLLLEHGRVDAGCAPTSEGAVVAAASQAGANTSHLGPAATDTGDFDDRRGPGNLRLDYALPSRDLEVISCGVFWPGPGDPGADLVEVSDHRLVWLDLR